MVDYTGIRRAEGRRVRRLQGPAVELLGAEFRLRFLVDPDRPVPREFQAAALAPLSQNSKERVCFGSGQAQPGESKPSGWFMDRSDRRGPVLYQHFGVPGAPVFVRRDADSDGVRLPLLSYYSKLQHPRLNTMLSSWPISGTPNTMRDRSPRDARTRRLAAPTFDSTPGSAAL
jgi:hypothetical protein